VELPAERVEKTNRDVRIGAQQRQIVDDRVRQIVHLAGDQRGSRSCRVRNDRPLHPLDFGDFPARHTVRRLGARPIKRVAAIGDVRTGLPFVG
jgi:hypothetical protein